MEIAAVKKAMTDSLGLAVTVDLGMTDGKAVSLTCPMSIMPRLVEFLTAAAVAAEKIQKAMPGSPPDVTTPHQAVDVRGAVTTDHKLVVLGFQTTGGYPVQVAMPETLARKTREVLERELLRLAEPPERVS